jgi:hypothetical protein
LEKFSDVAVESRFGGRTPEKIFVEKNRVLQ